MRSAANEATAKLAAVAAREISPEPPSGPSDELLREALTTNTATDLDNWKAWVEIESEPVSSKVKTSLCKYYSSS